MFPAAAPNNVPTLQPTYGVMMSPYIYDFEHKESFDDATANTSSVLTNEIIKRSIMLTLLSSFCDKDIDISAYLRFITSCVTASSIRVPPEAIMGTAASCPAEVTFVMDISTVSNTVSPLPEANIPNAKATDRYPRQIGIPS